MIRTKTVLKCNRLALGISVGDVVHDENIEHKSANKKLHWNVILLSFGYNLIGLPPNYNSKCRHRKCDSSSSDEKCISNFLWLIGFNEIKKLVPV